MVREICESEMNLHNFKINLVGIFPNQETEIFIDGRRITGVRNLEVIAGVGEVTRINMSFFANEVEISGEGDVSLDG